MDGEPRATFTFGTTHHALWAEGIAAERRIPAEIVPAPAEANAKCNLALETLAEDAARLAGELRAASVPHERFRPAPG